MTHDRTDTIRLPADMARCEPAELCTVRGTCARYQAALPKFSGSMADFSREPAGGGTVLCPGFLASHQYRQMQRPAVKPRVFGPME